MLANLSSAVLLALQVQTQDSLPPDSSRRLIDFNTQIGMYVPSGPPYQVNGILQKERQLAAIFAGASITGWLNDNVGLEGAIGYSPSMVAVHTPGNVTDMPAHIWTGSVRIIVSTAPRKDSWVFYAMVGPAFMARRRPRDFAPATVFGLGATLIYHPVSFRLEIADVVNSLGALKRNDFFVTMGLTLSLARSKKHKTPS